MDIVTIKGQLPGLNEYTAALANRKGRWSRGGDMKRDMTELCRLAALNTTHFKNPVYLIYTWFEPNARRDPDNVVFAKKFILDGLVHAGVLPNDTRKYILGWSESVQTDAKNPRIEIMISDQEK